MSLTIEALRERLARRDVRLAGFGGSAVASVYLGFIGIPVPLADRWVKGGGYFVMLLSTALLATALWRLRRDHFFTDRMSRGQWTLIAAVIGVLSLIAITAEPYHSKVLNDEFVLQSTAFNMHFYRDVATMVRGYEVGSTFVSLDNYLDKRPYFYPFLVSLLHDVSGYRPANAFVVNSILFPIALALAFGVARLFWGWRGGLLAVVLLGSLPLLGQNATGSGMELTNVVMILTATFLGAAFLADPTDERRAAFLLSIVLLAQSRYESALYVVAAAIILAVDWTRRRALDLPWLAALLPWLLLPVALQNKVLAHSPVLWELTETKTARFDLGYFGANLVGAGNFLFNRTAHHANSLVLSALGLLGLAWVGWRIVRWLRVRHALPGGAVALLAFGLVVVANTLLVLCYYWSRFDDPIAARFSLPLHLLMAFAAVGFVTTIARRVPVLGVVLLALGFGSVAAATAKFGYHMYSHMGVAEVEWQQRFIDGLPPASRLVVTNQSTVPWLLRKTPSILVGRARLVADRLHHQLHEPTFGEILVMQTLRPSTADGDHQVVPSDILPEFFQLELLAEKRFGTRISRISRLVGVELPANWKSAPSGPVARPTGE